MPLYNTASPTAILRALAYQNSYHSNGDQIAQIAQAERQLPDSNIASSDKILENLSKTEKASSITSKVIEILRKKLALAFLSST